MPVHRSGFHRCCRCLVVPDAGDRGLGWFPGEPGDEPGVSGCPAAVPLVRRERNLHRDEPGVRPVGGLDDEVGVPEAAEHIPAQVAPGHPVKVVDREGADVLQPQVRGDTPGVLDRPGPGIVSLEAAHVTFYPVEPRFYVRVPGLLLLGECFEPHWELKQLLAQDSGAYRLPPRWVGVEGLQEVVQCVDGGHGRIILPLVGW